MAQRLFKAVHAADLAALRTAIAAGEPLDARDKHGATPLLAAAQGGRTELCIALLDAGASPVAHDRKLTTRRWEKLGTSVPAQPAGPGSLLHEAAACPTGGDLVRALLARGLDLEARDPDGSTPLMIAAYRHRPQRTIAANDEPLTALLAAGADPEARDRAGLTALDTASHLATIERLLATSVDPNGAMRPGFGFYTHPLLVRWSISADPAIVRALLTAGADPAKAPGALAWAAHLGHTEVVRILLAHGFPADDTDNDTPALAAAATHAHLDIVRILLAAGARAHTIALFCAAGHPLFTGTIDLRERMPERLEIVRLLLAAGADPSAHEPRHIRATPLHNAARFGSAAITQLLLAAGAAVNATDDLGRTPLWAAAESGSPRVAELLLRAGASARTIARSGLSAYDVARKTTTPADFVASYPDTGAQLRVMTMLREAGGGPEKPLEASKPAGLTVDGRVRHAKFGDGTIRAVEAATGKLTIEFDDGITRILLARFITAVA